MNGCRGHRAGRAVLAAVAACAIVSSAGCPQPCSSNDDCKDGEVCAVADGKGTCVPAGSVPPGGDAGVPPDDDDAGEPDGDGGPPGPDGGADAGPDAGEPTDAGVDAGVVDAGNEDIDAGPQTLKLRGGIEVGPGVLRGGTKALKGRILSPGAGTATGGTLKLEAQGGGAPP